VDVIDFGTAVIDETLVRSVTLTNTGARSAHFTFEIVVLRELSIDIVSAFGAQATVNFFLLLCICLS